MQSGNEMNSIAAQCSSKVWNTYMGLVDNSLNGGETPQSRPNWSSLSRRKRREHACKHKLHLRDNHALQRAWRRVLYDWPYHTYLCCGENGNSRFNHPNRISHGVQLLSDSARPLDDLYGVISGATACQACSIHVTWNISPQEMSCTYAVTHQFDVIARSDGSSRSACHSPTADSLTGDDLTLSSTMQSD